MNSMPPSAWKDKALHTPGPLTTSRTVKQAMLRDLGSRDTDFISIVAEIRHRLLELAGVRKGDYEAVLLQGSGTFSVEAVLSSCIPPGGCLLTVINGAYGKRISKIAEVLGISHVDLVFPENSLPDTAEVAKALQDHPEITHVALVHCETTTGILNPLAEIGGLIHRAGKTYFVDAMSSFGAVPIDFPECHIDYLVSSANKCIEGVPGFGFVIARTQELESTQGYARSLSLDLHAQWKGLEKDGQFRFTPPTHALLAFHQALLELEKEGGVPGREARYRHNHEVLLEGTRRMGLEEYLSPDLQGWIITSFRYPRHTRFRFEEFYRRLGDRGFAIYPGKLSDADCFRIGTIGRLMESDIRALLSAMREVFLEMEVSSVPSLPV